MEEKKKDIPYLGCIDFFTGIDYAEGDTGLPEGFPKVRVIKHSKKNKDNAPFEVKSPLRGGVRYLKPGEPINWRQLYSEG